MSWIVDIDGQPHQIAITDWAPFVDISSLNIDGQVVPIRRTKKFEFPRGNIVNHAFTIGQHECSLRLMPGFFDGEPEWSVIVDGEVQQTRLPDDEQRVADRKSKIWNWILVLLVVAGIIAVWFLAPGWIDAYNRAPL